ncbi:MAG: Ni,Fe-hydrogenase III large subunit [Ferrovum sp.]|nr:Ni,Fe-hydrogenase III large subunit [Ferrovum sp.]NDU86583.1 Ni,Fe-hydrogenase III large subunit [Ferrovum sp.]
MTRDDDTPEITPLAGAIPARHGIVAVSDLRARSLTVKEQGGRLISLWGSDERATTGGYHLQVALSDSDGLLWLSVPLPSLAYPALEDIFPNAARMQRTLHDLLGLHPEGARDLRPWVRHGAWSAHDFPLRKDFVPPCPAGRLEDYPFVAVTGQGVHEIPVGPVHAGIIEPGHFRFAVVGERVLRLEERLGYTHKGLEKRAEGMDLDTLMRLAGRVSGDSTVAFSWATAMAAESILALKPPPRALWIRALLLERERIAQHLGDLGYLCNDAGLAAGFSQFWILREEWLRTQQQIFGHRLLMDQITVGGVEHDLYPDGAVEMTAELGRVELRVRQLDDMLQEHAGVQDRFLSTGRVKPDMAARFGMIGLAGRASAQAWDLRVQFPSVPYDHCDVRMATQSSGDVAARVRVRFEEIHESVRLLRHFLVRMPHSALQTHCPPGCKGSGAGWVEGWRGEVFVALQLDAGGKVQRWHPVDPSTTNWPLVEQAIMGNIVPDFPLINKSFNLSYSGQDL